MMLTDIGGYIATSMSLTAGNGLFLNWQPESPDQIVVLTDYLHDMPDITMRGTSPLSEHPRLQLLVRDLPMEVVQCESRCRTAYGYICAIQDMSLGSKRYTAIPMQTPTMVGRDEQQRVLYVCNFQVTQA